MYPERCILLSIQQDTGMRSSHGEPKDEVAALKQQLQWSQAAVKHLRLLFTLRNKEIEGAYLSLLLRAALKTSLMCRSC